MKYEKSYLLIFENLIKIVESIPKSHNIKPPKRNSIQNFSKKSRKRLIYFLNSLNFEKFNTKLFSTLTYHKDNPKDIKESKVHLHYFLIYLKRKFPDIEYIWKFELQNRKVEHFHLFILHPSQPTKNFIETLQKFIHQFWLKITDCNCNYCKRYKTKTYTVSNEKTLHLYLTKEIYKTRQTMNLSGGRFWGHSRNLKIELKDFFEIDEINYLKFIELLKDKSLIKENFYNHIIKNIDFYKQKNFLIFHKEFEKIFSNNSINQIIKLRKEDFL
jgi:hypothetical protein